MLVPLEPLMEVALDPVIDVPLEPITGALGGRTSRSARLRAACSISASWQSAK